MIRKYLSAARPLIVPCVIAFLAAAAFGGWFFAYHLARDTQFGEFDHGREGPRSIWKTEKR